MKGKRNPLAVVLPILAVGLAFVVILFWWFSPAENFLKLRVPGTDSGPGSDSGGSNPVLAGRVLTGSGTAGNEIGSWPQFRGPMRDGRVADASKLSRDWQSSPPRELWSLEVGEGYAGVAIDAGRVFLLDYDRDARQSSVRCLSLTDGKEIWRYTYPLTIKRNHGMTRTVPVVAGSAIVALDSKCNVFCLDAATGKLNWSVSLGHDFDATVPEWYAGQCPLVDGNQVILAPGGKSALLLALDLATGRPLWQTTNSPDWKMTHSSIMPMDFADRHMYVYCATKGVVGVDAKDGALLWQTKDWKISIATVPSPVILPDGRIFLTGGYGAGSLLTQLESTNGTFALKTLLRLPPDIFGATQHTPIFKDGNLYGARADGRFVCLDPVGKIVWTSGSAENFGLGAFLGAGDLIFALNDAGRLHLIEASPAGFNLLGTAQPLTGRESWAPMALAGGHLIVRDLTRLVCLDVSAR